MARNLQLSVTALNAQVNAVASRLNGGYLRVYSGDQPGTADTEITTQTLLAELRFSSPAIATTSNGVVTFDAISPCVPALAAGEATWFRCLTASEEPVLDGAISYADPADLVITPRAIEITEGVAVSGFSFSIPAYGE